MITLEAAATARKVTEFWTKIRVGRLDECWPWTGSADDDGYGMFFFMGRRRPAHELALTFTTGEIRITGLDTCHGCHNPPCCNLNHLRFDTRQGNVDDMIRAGRQVHPATVLSDEQVRIIRERRAAGAPQQDLADQYGVSDGLISMIVRGLKRADTGGPIATQRMYIRRSTS
jgi:hypothetical protein